MSNISAREINFGLLDSGEDGEHNSADLVKIYNKFAVLGNCFYGMPQYDKSLEVGITSVIIPIFNQSFMLLTLSERWMDKTRIFGLCRCIYLASECRQIPFVVASCHLARRHHADVIVSLSEQTTGG